ncbi:class I SAM-dependent methyltransferase [Streptomyces purpurogeneiscleroticus]|uniref:class I SAM-dependent methyltransferase n=1 Tax=Streptomyces purpurogeneiscleroticus TaxID=68259 RepID=UPI001CBC3465|nr:class I SAM-dependent methyltransferase [Streptomyces purpurogeneiscleroticus]
MTAQYDGVAGRMAEVERVIGPYRDNVEIPTVLEAIGSLAGTAVLDAGCGTGIYTRLLHQQGAAQTLGVDSSPAMVAAAQETEKRDPLGIKYKTADLIHLEPRGVFGLVTAISVLHYADTKHALHRMCHRLFAHLRPGGRLVAVVRQHRPAHRRRPRCFVRRPAQTRP